MGAHLPQLGTYRIHRSVIPQITVNQCRYEQRADVLPVEEQLLKRGVLQNLLLVLDQRAYQRVELVLAEDPPQPYDLATVTDEGLEWVQGLAFL